MDESREHQRRGRWTKAAVVGIAGLLTVGAAYQQVGQHLDGRKFPPPGELVDIGGRRIHLNCEGSGTPTVIAESGAGHSSVTWRHVVPIVAPRTRICVYDREGLGWSDGSSRTATRAQVSSDLSAALEQGGIEGPFVLVGHSLGGVYVRDFAARRSGDVVGMVLVDSSHENQISRMPEAFSSGSTGLTSAMMRVCHAASIVGIPRALRVWHLLSGSIGEDARAVQVASRNRTSYCQSIGNMLRAFPDTLDSDDPPASLGDMPLIVLSHGIAKLNSPAAIEWDATWAEMQSELAALSTSGEKRVIADAGHNIHLERPEPVAGAVLEVVAAARQRGFLTQVR